MVDFRRITDPQKDGVVSVWENGSRYRDIASPFRVSVKSVEAIIRRHKYAERRENHARQQASGETLGQWVERMYRLHGYQPFRPMAFISQPGLWSAIRLGFVLEFEDREEIIARLCPGAVRRFVRKS